ncbi:hypothetical protein DSO57_1029475 [Entomophthora muscae]|uniref:Uncharacterized protein n=1 Tax=Entomophthora muscae TaxID=34485 RepID=A0ACC2SQ87_9FUNG|nr:hypothetical protein DSO57_1029475 [Entomophthora muscae]
MEPPPTPKLTIATPPTSDATGQSSQFLRVLYLALTGLIDSVLPTAGPWAVAGKALSYLVKLGPIIWWAMLAPALTPPSLSGAPRYSWYPDTILLTGSKNPTHRIDLLELESLLLQSNWNKILQTQLLLPPKPPQAQSW